MHPTPRFPPLLVLSVLPTRNLAALAPRLGESNRDRLLAAGHLLARSARPQRPVLALVHRLLDFLRGQSSVSVLATRLPRHDFSLSGDGSFADSAPDLSTSLEELD